MELTEQELEFEKWWKSLPEDERLRVYNKTQMRMAWNAAWKAQQEKVTEADNAYYELLERE